MNNMKKIVTLSLALLAVASASASLAQNQLPKHVAGKVVAVSHEKVNVNNQWLDQIKVKVASCANKNMLEEVVYSPATVSDRTALGHLFEEDLTHARTANLEAQQQINGHGLFWVDANNHVLRTGLLGHNVDCRNVPQLLQLFQ